MSWSDIGLAGFSSAMDFGSSLFGDYRSRKAASSQRKWLQYMDNTKHQRNVADLRAAGLNPILSATGGSLGVPSAQMAQVPDYKTNSFQNYAAARQLSMQEKTVNAKVALDNELANKAAAEAGSALELGSLYRMNRTVAAEQAAQLASQTRLNASLLNLNSAQTRNAELDSILRFYEVNRLENVKGVSRYLDVYDRFLDSGGKTFDTFGKGVDAVNPVKGMFKKKRVGF